MVNLLYSFYFVVLVAHLMASSLNAKTRFLSKIGKRLENFLLKVGRRRGRV